MDIDSNQKHQRILCGDAALIWGLYLIYVLGFSKRMKACILTGAACCRALSVIRVTLIGMSVC